jgi:hypothetical protein
VAGTPAMDAMKEALDNPARNAIVRLIDRARRGRGVQQGPGSSRCAPPPTGLPMADVSGNTLLMAVQAVNDAIAALDERIRDGSDDPLDDTQMLMSFTRAAEELRACYEVARLTSSNLPPYEALIEPDQE